MNDQSVKYCPSCKETKPHSDYHWRTVSGRRHPRAHCKICENLKRRRRSYMPNDDPRRIRSIKFRNHRWKTDRHYGTDIGRFILSDSRKADRLKNRANDLDLPFIDSLIIHPCTYCLNDTIRMTLDRIDNDKGHTRDNVQPACIRCNYLRRDMPYDAWLYLVPSIREAVKLGLFGEWHTLPLNQSTLESILSPP
jgi:hypothetical protein